MQAWSERPLEVAHLFNPAFCSVLIAKTTETYSKVSDEGMSFGLTFLVLPIVLHEDTRSALPHRITTPFLAWIESHQAELVGFPDRVRRLLPVTREAVIFSLAHGALQVNGGGSLVPGEINVSSAPSALKTLTPDSQECIKKSLFLGRWLPGAGTPATVMASWGVAP